jgi:glycosyltransferase involved in cell wall biosynthesis
LTGREHRATFITILPSPYQRDLFAALAARSDVALSVHYMEDAAPDSPWPMVPLRPFERIMPGFWVPFRGARLHVNWRLPDVSTADFVIVSTFSSWTGQRLMRGRLRGSRWLFWGERLRVQASAWRGSVQRVLTTPLAQATAIVAIGRDAERDYARRFPDRRTFSIPYHCDLSAFLSAPRHPDPQAPLTLLFCGQMIRRKGVDLLLRAFDRIVAKGANVQLMLLGREADLQEFLAAVAPAARARIRYEGFQPPERLPEFFARADVFILPSRYDGWGVVVNQALGAGLPVITSDAVGAGLDLVENGVNGLRFPAGDADQLQHCIERLVASRETARAWGEASRRRALDLTPEAGAEKWVRAFDSLSGQG